MMIYVAVALVICVFDLGIWIAYHGMGFYEDIEETMELLKKGYSNIEEINEITNLKLEIMAGKDKTTNIITPPKGDWRFERSSGYNGWRCKKCATWVYDGNIKFCDCDVSSKN